MQLHQLKRFHKNKKTTKVGRGGKRGKTAGRGTKGQKARSGHKLRPEIRDLIKKLPKLRGRGKNSNTPVNNKPLAVNLSQLNKVFKAGDDVSPKTLQEKGVISLAKGRLPRVKILATGEIKVKVTVTGCLVSEAAKAKIEKAGGSVV